MRRFAALILCFVSSLPSSAALTEFPTWGRGTYTGTVVGCTTSPTLNITYFRVTGLVALTVPTVSCTSNSTSFSITGAPASITPDAQSGHTNFRGTNNGAGVDTTWVRMNTSGTLVMRLNASDTGFTASGAKGIANTIQHTYSTDNA